MNERIFLRKYRVAFAEPDPAGESGPDSGTHQGVEIDSGKKVSVELFPAASFTTAARERLEAEANAAKRLRHPNIPALYDFGIEDDQLVYVSEYAEGTVAEKWIKSYGPIPVSPVLSVASQVVGALSAAAFHQIVHQNINPRNLILMPGQTAEGEWPLVKVLHFAGSAPRPDRSSPADTGKLDPYASPEQSQQGTIDFRSEMYSLGSTMWFLLTGAPPPMAWREESSKPVPSMDMLKGVPKSVRGLLARMLSANPEERPGDPLAFSRLLQECQSHLQGPENVTRTSASSARASKRVANESEHQWNRTRVVVVAAVPLVLAALAIGAWFSYVRPRPTVPAKRSIAAPKAVPKATPSGTPVALVAKTENKQSSPAASAGPERVAKPWNETDLVQRAAVNLVPIRPIWPITARWFRNPPRPPEPANIVLPMAPDFSPGEISSFVSATLVEVPTSAGLLRSESENKVTKKAPVHRTERADPEVRRAEPAAPAEGPIEPPRRKRSEPKASPAPRAREIEPVKPTPKAKMRFPLPPFARPPR